MGAYALILTGVPVVHDDCGSNGFMAPLIWFDPEVLIGYARRHPIIRRKKDSLTWHVLREERSGDLHLAASLSMRWLDEAPR